MIAMLRHRTFWICTALLACSAGWNTGARAGLRAQAQSAASVIDNAILTGLKWRSIGPLRGGRSIAVSGVKGRPREGYFGATGGGLWKTTDGGSSWTPMTDGQITTSSIGAIAVAESNPNTVFIGIRRGLHPRQHHAGRRRLQVHRRRQDLEPHRLHGLRRHLENPRPSDQPGHRLRRRLRQVRRAERRARPLQVNRRRPDLAAQAVPRQQDRRDRRRDRSQEPERDVRGDVGGLPRRVPDVERRAGQRPLQVHRRRRDVARDHADRRPAAGARTARCRSRSRPRTRIASTRSSKTTRAASTSPTMRARPGSW